jgi:hypothetical protein
MKVTKKKRLLTANILFKTGMFFNKYEFFTLDPNFFLSPIRLISVVRMGVLKE